MPRDGAPTRQRILDAAETLVIDNGFAATSVDEVIAASGSSKGSFFHHFPTKIALAEALVARYAEADLRQLTRGLEATASISDPRERLVAFLRLYEEEGDALMAEQSGCLYASVMAERQLTVGSTGDTVAAAVTVWREQVAALIRQALGSASAIDPDAWADHLFVTFEGAFILCRSTGEPRHMRAQLRVFREAVEALLAQNVRDDDPA